MPFAGALVQLFVDTSDTREDVRATGERPLLWGARRLGRGSERKPNRLNSGASYGLAGTFQTKPLLSGQLIVSHYQNVLRGIKVHLVTHSFICEFTYSAPVLGQASCWVGV